jgi:Mrp family chromosome partitioning ATPase
MFRKRSKAQQTESHPMGDGTPLILQTIGCPVQYRFSASIVQAHRHMITRLMRDQRLAGRLCLVSALRGEGVTYSSLAMATTLSHDFSQRVCYVDLNWWWPAQQLADVNQYSQGIAGILNEHAQISDVLVRTGASNLCLLPAGHLPPEQRPIVARSSELKAVLAQLGELFDTVVLDIPAILATSDAMVLASLGDSCLVVIRQGATTTASVKQALDDIAHMPVTGVLLNRVRVATPTWVRTLIPDL